MSGDGDVGSNGARVEDLQAQIRALQEQVAFGDHASDQLSGELLRAFQAIQSLGARLDRVEARLGEVLSSVEERLGDGDGEPGGALDGLELPPHSMGDRADRIRDAEQGG